MNVLWTRHARQRLLEIEAYIARDSPRVARQMVLRLLHRSSVLQQPPLLGHRLSQYTDADIRELLERPFRLIFRVRPEQIEVLTVLHYRQLLPSDLANLQQAPLVPDT